MHNKTRVKMKKREWIKSFYNLPYNIIERGKPWVPLNNKKKPILDYKFHLLLRYPWKTTYSKFKALFHTMTHLTLEFFLYFPNNEDINIQGGQFLVGLHCCTTYTKFISLSGLVNEGNSHILFFSCYLL